MTEALAEALREAERFIAYYSGETDGCFVGTGTPSKCLEQIRAALAAYDAAPAWTPPPEAERESGFRCSITVAATWTPCVSGGGWWVVTDADGVLRILDANVPTAFAPLPQGAP